LGCNGVDDALVAVTNIDTHGYVNYSAM
jgi:hypothetical protein